METKTYLAVKGAVIHKALGLLRDNVENCLNMATYITESRQSSGYPTTLV